MRHVVRWKSRFGVPFEIFSTLTRFSETSLDFHQTTRRYTPEDITCSVVLKIVIKLGNCPAWHK
jgi:hypothetical protein